VGMSPATTTITEQCAQNHSPHSQILYSFLSSASRSCTVISMILLWHNIRVLSIFIHMLLHRLDKWT